MDFIEQLFGVAPDGGNGALELTLLMILLLAVPVGQVLYILWHRDLPRWMTDYEFSDRD